MKEGIRIGIDARPLQPPWAGIARYQSELCRELDRCLPEAQFFLYTHRPIQLPVQSPRWHVRQDPFRHAAKLKNVVWLKTRMAALCREDSLDLFWSPDPFLPNLPQPIPTVATVHDVNAVLAPETMNRAHRWAHKLYFEADLRRARAIVSVSRGTQQRLAELTGIHATTVIPPAVNQHFRRREPAVVQTIVHEKYHLEPPYLLAVATWEPRKNLSLVLDSFEVLRREAMGRRLTLALVGGRGWQDSALAERISQMQQSGLRVLGYVPEDDLPALYSGAACFVFPSRYEGFGSPVIEARACGAPIVTTDIPELHESGREAAIYVTPTLDGVTAGIKQALGATKPAPREDDLPQWAESAAQMAQLFRDLTAATAHSRARMSDHGAIVVEEAAGKTGN